MRSEQEMYGLILDTAKQDGRIKAVYMNGSRTNVHAPRDIFQDYDIVYVVEETGSFIEDRAWIQRFGDIWYMQYPDESPDCQSGKEHFYGWLMQFRDGNRLDLHVETVEHARAHIGDDRLCRVLLDKDGVLPPVEEATDKDYHVKKPKEVQFRACCNEFWWCSNNLAKGLWREEIPYVQDMANFIVRKELETMLSWKVGVMTGFSVSVGKSAKYLNRWLAEEEYRAYLATYFGGGTDEAWTAVIDMCNLFEETAKYVADALGFVYDEAEGAAAKAFLLHAKELPKDAAKIYENDDGKSE